MNILYYCEQTNSIMSMWQTYHIFDELRTHGVNIDVCNRLESDDFNSSEDQLKFFLNNKKYDLFMTYFNEKKLCIAMLGYIKSLKIPTLLICFDNSLIPYFHKNICKYFDLTWLMENSNLKLFNKWGANVIFMPYAANPNCFAYKKYNSSINAVAFVGTPYGSRANTINKLANAEVQVALFGNKINNTKHNYKNGFLKTVFTDLKFPNGRKILRGAFIQKFKKDSIVDYASPFVSHLGFVESLSDVYSQYGLSLSSTTARNTGVLKKPIDVIDLRSFEIPMCGGIQFCRFNPELAKYFEEDKEIIFYHSDEDMIRKAKFYLSDDAKDIRENIRKAARARAERDHTWWKRFVVIFDKLGIEH